MLDKHRSLAFSERDKGSRFERLMQAYLRTDPQFHLQQVWLWNEFPCRADLGGMDTGIDLVALTADGEYWAVQCKCVQESAVTDKPAVDSFLSASGRSFRDRSGIERRFTHRLWISTTNRWGANAEETLRGQSPAVSRISLHDLLTAPVDWDKLESGVFGEAARTARKTLRPPHQTAKTQAHFKSADRGKLIMACGTGKIFTALRIAEQETGGSGLILFLVPSIALLGQTLREWSADAAEPLNAVCVCSDPEISKKKSEDAGCFSTVDLALPASTSPAEVRRQLERIKAAGQPGLTVLFSTYQSIEVIARVQQELLAGGFPAFDLIICDEAHRTTGVTLAGKDESAFVKVHDPDFLKAKRRLYMTATPRLYTEDAKSRAKQADAVLCSMDEEKLYGPEIYRIGFGEAVERGLLADYKVLILTLNDQDVPPAVQRMLAAEGEIGTDDGSKLIGCVNALSKQFIGKAGDAGSEPMRRAVAFCQSIKTSKQTANVWNSAADAYLSSLPADAKERMVCPAARHIDGTMSAPERDELLAWLKAEPEGNECHILCNVRVLSEGVDVPSLDAVLFLSAKNSQVDVVQSVGRVMRNAPGKKYGWIIIPVLIPADVEPDKALNDNKRYSVVWTVLNALRAHDDRFNATVNKIDLNDKKPDNILIGRPEYAFDNEEPVLTTAENAPEYGTRQLALQFVPLRKAIYARMVEKVGDRRYWEQWAKDVAEIAARQIERITYLIKSRPEQQEAFASFLDGLQRSINPGIGKAQAVEMLAQHLVTGPVFEALFEGSSFVHSNAVSVAMHTMLDKLKDENLAADSETLQKFYASVRKRAEGIDNAEGKRHIIGELYDKFFRTAFPKMAEQLGIVYTPVEAVDFIIRSVDDVLLKEFGRSLSDENVHILDPFTGTGTFITRLIESGLIRKEDLARKYKEEIHCNEIVLLAYYIAAVNIENVWHDLSKESSYTPFDSICLTDTFQIWEDGGQRSIRGFFQENSERIDRQKKAPLRVIIGNPPYSAGQKSANDNAQNRKYELLDRRIAETYAAESTATLKNSLYDSYFRAFRWSSDRLNEHGNGGVIAFISNGGWLDSRSAEGFRKCLEREFSSIYVFNLRGNARTTGELNRKEGEPLFGATGGSGGSKAPIAITLLVKNPASGKQKAEIYYYNIGDYLKRKEKLAKIREFVLLGIEKMPWQKLSPDKNNDWINQRNSVFETFIQIGDKDRKENKAVFFVPMYSNGVKTNRDAWVYNFSGIAVSYNMQETINIYNESVRRYSENKDTSLSAEDFIDFNEKKIRWTREIKWDVEKRKIHEFYENEIVEALYRPFTKKKYYFDKNWNNTLYQMPKLFPEPFLKNLVICVYGIGGTKDHSTIISNCITDVNCLEAGTQCFPLYWYEKKEAKQMNLFRSDSAEYVRRDGISDFILERARRQYGKTVSKEDIFYYVYGFLHSPDYRAAFANDLKKSLPRLPLVDEAQDFWAFSKAGRELAELHVNYEEVPPCPGVEISGADSGKFRVEKMRFPEKGRKDAILFNHWITVANIPEKAYQYVVNGKSAIEWVMERYQVTVHKDSGIENDPNDWAKESGRPRYILDLLLSVINLSIQTVEIVERLPKVSFEG